MTNPNTKTLYVLFTGDESYAIHWPNQIEDLRGVFASIELAQQAVEDYFNALIATCRHNTIESGNKEKRQRLRFYPTEWKDEDGILRRGMRIKDWDWVTDVESDRLFGCEVRPVTLNAWIDDEQS